MAFIQLAEHSGRLPARRPSDRKNNPGEKTGLDQPPNLCLSGLRYHLGRRFGRAERRVAWFESYLTTLIERDIRDIVNLQDRAGLTRLLRLLAARSGTLSNASELSRTSGLPDTTLNRYQAALEALFLVWFLPACSGQYGQASGQIARAASCRFRVRRLFVRSG